MTKDEALKMAIEYLEAQGYSIERQAVLDACKEALATNEKSSEVQPAQEPVAWMNDIAYGETYEELDGDFGKVIPLYTHPHQWQGNKEFVGLTDYEIEVILDDTDNKYATSALWSIMYYRAIEQALKDKNT